MDCIKTIINEITDNELDIAFLVDEFDWMIRANSPDPCHDNYRVKNINIHSQDEQYEKKFNSGCCGSTDKLVYNNKTNNKFLIGFNYGH